MCNSFRFPEYFLFLVALTSLILTTSDRIHAQADTCFEVFPDMIQFDKDMCILTFAYEPPDTEYVHVYDCSGEDFYWMANANEPWVGFEPAEGTHSDSIAVWIEWGHVPVNNPPPPGDTILLDALLIIYAPEQADSVKFVEIQLVLTCEMDQSVILVCEPDHFNITLQPGDSVTDSFHVYEVHGDTVEFTFSNSSQWLHLPLVTITYHTPDIIHFYVDSDTLPPGVYVDTIVVMTAEEPSNSPVNIPVVLTVTGSSLTLATSPTSFTYNLEVGDVVTGDSLYVYEIHGESVNFWTYNSSTWLEVDTMSASPLITPGTVFLNIQTDGLSPGVYTDTILIFSSDSVNSPLLVPVSLILGDGSYTVMTNPTSIQVYIGEGDSAYTTLYVYEVSGAHLSFVAFSGEPWLNIEPGDPYPCMTPTTLGLFFNAGSLAPGTYIDTVFIVPDTDHVHPFPPVAVPAVMIVESQPSSQVVAAPNYFDLTVNTGDILSDVSMLVYEIHGNEVPFLVTSLHGSNWLGLEPVDTALIQYTPDSVHFDIIAVGLEPGFYADTIIIFNPLAYGPQYNDVAVPVFLTVMGGDSGYVVETYPSYFSLILNEGDSWIDSLRVEEAYGRPLDFSVSNNEPWLEVVSNEQVPPYQTPLTLNVFFNTESLPLGSYSDTILIIPEPPSDSIPYRRICDPVAVPVYVTITSYPSWVVIAEPDQFNLAVAPGDSLLGLSIYAYELHGDSVPFIATSSFGSGWLQIFAPDTLSVTPGNVLFNVFAANLAPGIYVDTIIIYNPLDGPVWYEDVKVPVRLTVTGDEPEYVVETSPSSFYFAFSDEGTITDSLFVHEIHGYNVGFFTSTAKTFVWVEPFGMPPYMTPTVLSVIVHEDTLPYGIFFDTIFINPAYAEMPFAPVEVPVVISVGGAYCPGDSNCDQEVNVADAIHLINYVFRDGPPPIPLDAADANCDLSIDVADIVYIVNHIFKDGPQPGCR